MSEAVKEIFNKFGKKKRFNIKTCEGNKTTLVVPEVLYEHGSEFCKERGMTITELCRWVDKERPAELNRTEAVRIVLSQIYFNPGEMNIDA